MPRTARFILHNASHHITCRGSRRAKVFLSTEDFEKYLSLLWKYKNRYNAKIYAYCLMTNHVHLLIATDPPGTLSKIMQGLSLSYAQYFNVKYKKCGHLWQNRYKSKPVQKDQYLINVASYIEYNPIRAKMCHRAEEYPWSSYRERVLEGSNKAIDQIII